MTKAFAVLALLLALAPAAAAAVTPRTTLPDVEDEVMCITCGTVLNVSEAPSADREREFIRRRIAEGSTKAEIKRLMVEQYGPKVLATPHDKSWVVPILLAVMGLTTVGVTVRRWKHSATPERAEPDLDDADAQRLADDMKAYDL
ncbi:MAG: cytochrome c-type biosis protein CcmH [Solirubrobacteraceae bacterium]|jgi:cytochrome c-type biogenesis protein CcmH/NrfF|nr:cytochrome c-type biosis protein CcmH [Solirubrobacteraceae bacterium]